MSFKDEKLLTSLVKYAIMVMKVKFGINTQHGRSKK